LSTALFVKLQAKAGERDSLLAALAAELETVRSEGGTRCWFVHEVADSPDLVWLYELYEDAAALQAHQGSAAMAELRKAFGELLDGPPEVLFGSTLDASSKGLS
jgi:quinol monooxygenase YgiN